MKKITVITFLFLTIFLSFTTIVLGADKNWYDVTIDEGRKTYTFTGTINLSESNIADELSKPGFLKIENLKYRQSEGGRTIYKEWTLWDPNKKNFVFINKRRITVINPLLDNPNKVK